MMTIAFLRFLDPFASRSAHSEQELEVKHTLRHTRQRDAVFARGNHQRLAGRGNHDRIRFAEVVRPVDGIIICAAHAREVERHRTWLVQLCPDRPKAALQLLILALSVVVPAEIRLSAGLVAGIERQRKVRGAAVLRHGPGGPHLTAHVCAPRESERCRPKPAVCHPLAEIAHANVRIDRKVQRARLAVAVAQNKKLVFYVPGRGNLL